MKQATWVDKLFWKVERPILIWKNKIFLALFKSYMPTAGQWCENVEYTYVWFNENLDLGQDE
jgi:hypothetical protein